MSLQRVKPCKWCGGVNHQSYQCWQRKDHKQHSLKQKGKVGKQWDLTRAKWIKENPPDEYGNWYCYLHNTPQCPIILTRQTLTLDHIKSRSRHPELRFTQSNLAPACWFCNGKKGPRNYGE